MTSSFLLLQLLDVGSPELRLTAPWSSARRQWSLELWLDTHVTGGLSSWVQPDGCAAQMGLGCLKEFHFVVSLIDERISLQIPRKWSPFHPRFPFPQWTKSYLQSGNYISKEDQRAWMLYFWTTICFCF